MPDPGIFALRKTAARICYGFQATQQLMGGRVAKAERAKYGTATFVQDGRSPLFAGVPKRFRAWMSHGDEVQALGPEWKKLAHTSNSAFAAAQHVKLPFYLIQFHPRSYTRLTEGRCCTTSFPDRWSRSGWSMKSFLRKRARRHQSARWARAGSCAGSRRRRQHGGGDVVSRAVGERLYCVLVDHGLLREGEAEQVALELGAKRGLNVTVVDAHERFLAKLAGVVIRSRSAGSSAPVHRGVRGRGEEDRRGRVPGAGHALSHVIESASAAGARR